MAARWSAFAWIARTAGRVVLRINAIALATALAPAAGAQEPPPTHPGTSRAATGWDLPRVFYDAHQRRSLDAQDRAIRLGLDLQVDAPSGPRFDGWLSGPSGTNAWVSGTRYVADRTGRLRSAGDSGTAEVEGGTARLDRARGVLVIRRESEGTLQLRVGESDYPLEPAATRPAGSGVRP